MIDRQLDLLHEVPDLRVVIGHQADAVITAVTARRPDAIFVFNREYASTGTGDSLLLASSHVAGDIVSVDGALLFDKEGLEKMLRSPGPLLGVSEPVSDDPVFVQVQTELGATAFSRHKRSAWEWTGLVRLSAARLIEAGESMAAPRHVFQILHALLPIKIVTLRARDIDTPADLEAAGAWLRGETLPRKTNAT